MKLDPQISAACLASAGNLGIEPAAMLAFVEVESRGQPFEPDGVTPRFLFEKHIFWRELGKISVALQSEAAHAGLATPKWLGNYQDQKTSGDRLTMLTRARAIDTETANRSASWGLGQVLGANAVSLGYSSATALVQELSKGGIAAHVEAMERFIRVNGLIGPIKALNWVRVAEGYNGKEQAKHNYSGRLSDAYLRWKASPPTAAAGTVGIPAANMLPNVIFAKGSSGEEVHRLQRTLHKLNYPVGTVDGIFGSITQKAVFLFQRCNGLQPTGVVDQQTRAALASGKPLPVGEERAKATVETLRDQGSATVAATDRGKLYAGGLTGAGIIGFLESILGRAGDAAGPFGTVLKAALGAVSGAPVLEPLVKLVPLLVGPGHGLSLVAALLSYMLWRNNQALAKERVEDHRNGVNRAR
ncbi:MAG: N-acetylmuramidase domain-containing protein [Beijerinckiaceae bacterium]